MAQRVQLWPSALPVATLVLVAGSVVPPRSARAEALAPLVELHQRLPARVCDRVDALALYGFLTADEKVLFEKLIGVTGIGPTLAVKVLSGVTVADLVDAIRRSEIDRLVRIPGVGKKTAERMVLELRDKLPQPGPTSAPAVPVMGATEEDVLSALLNLGYQRAAAEKALAAATKNGKGGSFDLVFRDALAALSK